MRKQLRINKIVAAVWGLGLGLGIVSGNAHAAGFNLLEQNASGLGLSYAGSAAISESPGDLYFNPASGSLLDGYQFSTSLFGIKPGFKFNDTGTQAPGAFAANGIAANAATQLVTAQAMSQGVPAAQAQALGQAQGAKISALSPSSVGGNGGDGGSWAAVPSLAISYKLNDRVGLGLSVNAPFGLTTNFDNNWAGRFHSKKFSLETYNINPSVSYKINEQVAVGLGFNAQYLSANYEKSQVLPAGTIDVPNLATFGLLAGQSIPYFAEGHANVKLHSWAYGWNAGVLFTPSENTRIGLAYRSSMRHNAKGTTTITTPTGMTINGPASATAVLPDTAILSLYQRINPKWELMSDIAWTGWSSLQSLDIKSELPGLGTQTSSLKLNFRDTWRLALGGRYEVNDKLKLSTGVAWDQSPIKDPEHRLASLPDNNRYWFSLGAQYQASKQLRVDVGYAYLYLPNAKINNDNGNPAQYGKLKGDVSASGHVIGAGLTYRF